ncbi:hypothetical protein EJ08DRAFT_663716 [Tothia fuscella]|uniref:RRM domain-containing protein n=1 Tax=Tothia fuscella TaxID=1048955 RepID=A0A9P4NK01_9PEZI|nr:hypothetical protein EJ08DRAFT_663716 [Tothia fuscella]
MKRCCGDVDYREKKKKQQLADQILGSGRRNNAQTSGNGRKPPTGPSLASRMGVSKVRAASNSPRPSIQGGNDSRPGRPQAPRPNIAKQRTVSTPQLNQRNHALNSFVNGGSGSQQARDQFNVVQPRRANGSEINIRGAASTTYTVIAQNFALGTTANDIEAVLCPDADAAGLLGCRLIASNPTVIAEVRLTNGDLAQSIVDMYNNQKADGRLLHVYIKDAPTVGSRRPRMTTVIDLETMEVDEQEEPIRQPYQTQSRTNAKPQYDAPRTTRAEPKVQDGRYGFNDDGARGGDYYEEERQNNQYNRRGRGGNGGGLVSDGMVERENQYYRR